MSDARDEQSAAEVLDGDHLDPAEYPPEHLLGADALLEKDVPAAGEYAPDSLEERMAREEPDFGEVDLRDGGGGAPELIDVDDPFGDDLTKELVAEAAEAPDDLDPAVLSDAATSSYESTLPAEEAAIHLVGEDEGR
jgi:hypothetical protein